MKKICFKCKQEKDISEFYEHPQMTDGHLGKCISCTKRDNRLNRKTEKTKIREKARNSLPQRRTSISKRASQWRKENPEKYKAHNKVCSALKSGKIIKPSFCEKCGSTGKLHAHHEDYSKPLDVIWLCVPCHGKRNPRYIED
jgi:hypothetical protein